MLQTIEAIYDPKQGLAFSEAIDIRQPVRVLVTFITPCQPSVMPDKGGTPALLAALLAHPLPEAVRLADSEIEAHVHAARDSWEEK